MTIRPGPRLVRALLAAAAPALAAPIVPAAAWLAVGAALGVVAIAAWEALRLRKVALTVERDAMSVLFLGEDETLAVVVRHGEPRPIDLVVRCRWPAIIGGGDAVARGRCAAGAALRLEFSVRGGSRGEAELPPVAVAATLFGLVERIVEPPAPAAVRVMPNLAAVRRLHRKLNDAYLRGLGSRISPRAGQGREFDRLRDYVTGDDYRNMAWKATARRGRPIMRDFRVERSQDVLLCVDRGHRMAARVGEVTRVDHAVDAAVLAAYLCDRSEDRVGLLSYAHQVDRGVPQGRGAAHLAALTAFASAIAADYLPTDYRALSAHLRRRLRTRTLVIIYTTLPERGDHEDLVLALRTMLPRHLPLVVVMRDPVLDAVADAQPADRRELCRTLVAGDLVLGRRQLVREMRRLGALVVEAEPHEAGLAGIDAYLDAKRRQLL